MDVLTVAHKLTPLSWSSVKFFITQMHNLFSAPVLLKELTSLCAVVLTRSMEKQKPFILIAS